MATRKPKHAARNTSRSKGAHPKGSGAAPKSGSKARRAKRPAKRKTTVKRARAVGRPPAPRATRPGVPNAIGLLTHHLDYTCHDIESVKHFYTGILGFRRFEHDLKFNYLTVTTSPTSSIGFMPPMAGPPEQWRPPREPATYFIVEDVDRVCEELRAQGIALEQEPTNMPWGHRVAVTRDPEGRAVCLAQMLKR